MKIFAIPAALTAALFGWWIYALTVPVHIVQPEHGYGAQSHASWLNALLAVIVALSWVAAAVYRDGQK